MVRLGLGCEIFYSKTHPGIKSLLNTEGTLDINEQSPSSSSSSPRSKLTEDELEQIFIINEYIKKYRSKPPIDSSISENRFKEP
ncbi:unnamed protein product [Didymodactylos carnosus]|uniref:Uncharacterized protein n=1 Tax=Didymodactylos carnosus TaxID=1234261 RepID=A0A814R199_9BILA|nr:unnamed protein product [Didymodactylos carnosus]CAF1127856.1 unnamed protein product [Didymodactylos carnosus]CAF3703455.1 unnamed protein product [Didymodactylos carnosus]CAF3891435.1 unnamed protein product [Didymodactylos carnosus]